jgi:hypothetical protein
MKKTVLASLLLCCGIITFAQEKKTEKEPFKPSGKVWGLAFGDFAYKAHADELNRGAMQYANIPTDYNSFDFRRIYLGYDYQISEKFSVETLLAYEGGTNLDAGGNRTVLIKAANLRWKNIFKNADLVVGQLSTPSFANADRIWSYRSIEKTIIDQRGISKSSDIGVAIQGKFDDKGIFGYNLMVGNGTGTKPETDKYKKLYTEIYGKFLDQKLFVGVNFDYEGGKFGSLTRDRTFLKLTAAYQTPTFMIGGEIFQQSVAHNAVVKHSPTPNDTTSVQITGYSIFAKKVLMKDKLTLFARYDNYNPDANYASENTYVGSYTNYSEDFITVGLDFTPIKNVHFMPNIWLNQYQSKLPTATGNAKNDYDLALRATFFYNFGR